MKRPSNKPSIWLILFILFLTFAAPMAAILAALHFTEKGYICVPDTEQTPTKTP